MQKLNPNDIVDVIRLVGDIFSDKRNPTKEENNKINTFFTIYMGKAMEECQDSSKTQWTPLKPKSELCFAHKIVNVKPKMEEGVEPTGEIEFIVATTRSVSFNDKDLETFKAKTQEKVIEQFGDKDDQGWTMVFNKLMFGKDKQVKAKTFINGLFVGIRFDKSFFVPKEETTA